MWEHPLLDRDHEHAGPLETFGAVDRSQVDVGARAVVMASGQGQMVEEGAQVRPPPLLVLGGEREQLLDVTPARGSLVGVVAPREQALVVEALEREGIDDRAVDLWSPLLAVTFVADLEDGSNRSREILDAAKDLATVREADADAGPTARLLEALLEIREREGETIAPADLLEALRARPGWDWLKSTRRLAGLLNPLGIVRQQVRDGARRRWCYILQAGQLADLRARYGGASDAGDQPEGSFFPSDPVTTGASGDNPHK